MTTIARARGAWLGAVAGLLLGCGHTEQDRNPGDPAAAGMASGGSNAGGNSVGADEQAGQPPLVLDPLPSEPVPPVPEDLCNCPYTRLGMTVMLGETNERLGFNIAEQSACATDQPAHISVTSSCGQSVSLALSVNAEGDVPRLVIHGDDLTYTDRSNVVWTGYMPRSLEDRPGEGSVLTSALQIAVVNAAGEKGVLQLAFELCADWSSILAPC